MLTQTIYLLVLNSFNYGNSNSSEGYYGFFTNQINDFISQFTKNIDINFNFKPGTEMSNEEMTVALRKQLFDDRLTIETNFGVIIPTSTYASNYVAIAGIEGFVKDVSMLCTKVLTVDNKLIIVPNSEAMGGKITNFSAEELRRVDIETKAGYANKFEDVYKAVLEAVKDTPTALMEPAPFVRVSGYTDYAVVYTIRVWTKSENYWDCYFDLMQKVGEFKDKNGVVGGVPSMRYISDK